MKAYLSAGRLRYWVVCVLIAELYFVVGRLSLMLAFLHPSASPVWPPTGLALAALLLLGKHYWPAILAGAFFVNVTTEGGYLTSAVIAVGNTLEAVVGYVLVTRFAGGAKAFESVRGVVMFSLLAVLLSPVVSATFGVAALLMDGSVTRHVAGHVWLTWWLGDMVGSVTIAPLVVLWFTAARESRGWKDVGEALLIFLTILVVASIVYTPANLPLGYMCLLPILWTAIRFTPRDTALCVVVVSVVSIAGTLRGWGPFATDSTNESLLFLQAFVSVAAFIGLLLSSAILERRLAERSLEACVQERTQELMEARAQDRANLERLRNMLAHMTVGAVAVDERLKILHQNDAFRNLFKLRSGADAFHNLTDVFTKIRSEFQDPHETIDGLLRLLSERQRTTDMPLTLENGALVYCDYVPVFDGDTHRGHLFLFRERPNVFEIKA